MKVRAGLLCAVTLTCCASPQTPAPAVTWTGGAPTRLAADKAACEKESANIDINSASGYSDPRYGATNAMAAALNRDSPLTDRRKAVRNAAMTACMNDKGWHAL